MKQPSEGACLLWNWLKDQCAGDFFLPVPRQADEHPHQLPSSFDLLGVLGNQADEGFDFNNNTPEVALPWFWRIRKAPYRMQLGFYRLIWHMILLLRRPLGMLNPLDTFSSEPVFDSTSFKQWFRCERGSFFPSPEEIPEEREYLRRIIMSCLFQAGAGGSAGGSTASASLGAGGSVANDITGTKRSRR
jgi:hypothetical protein